MLTRKHFEILADTIGQIDCPIKRDVEIRIWLPHLKQNPQFDETKFREAITQSAKG